MAYKMQNMKGSLFDNDKKGKESAPDFKGSIKIDDKEFWLSAWKNKSQAGADYISLSVQEKTDAPKEETKVEVKAEEPAIGDDIPF
jgi:uncharacterized protein (DUF736 family)